MAIENQSVPLRRVRVPKDGLKGLQENWKGDLLAGFILFMVALPLSVGISLASGAPATAGIFSAVVGGILGALMSGSYITINGAAAGLIVIVLTSIQELGKGDAMLGFKLTLAATVVAGLIQIGMGLSRMGTLGLSFPGAVIHGMLAAIGVIIMSKQIHVALGVKPAAASVFGLIQEIPKSILLANPDIATIGAVSLTLMILFAVGTWKPLKRIPAPLVVVCVAIGLGSFFDLDHQHTLGFFAHKYPIGPNFLLNIPDHLAAALVSPDFSQWSNWLFIKMAITIALVASLESVLSTYAVDKLDPYRRSSDLNRDLWAKGVCNVILGSIGGLPVISEIVRSSANVSNGAKTRWSNFFHGVFMLFFVMTFPHLLHEIPLSALAAILLVVGFRLAHPSQLLHAKALGFDHLAVFVITFLTTLGTDLLVGVGVGILAELMFSFAKRLSIFDLFRIRIQTLTEKGTSLIKVESPAIFTNYIFLKKVLDQAVAKPAPIVIDLTETKLVDHTVLEHLHHYEERSREQGRKFEIRFSRSHQGVTQHPLSTQVLTRVPKRKTK